MECLEFDSRADFEAEVQRRRKSAPEVQSAYQPSGNYSLGAAVLLVGGATVGAGIGAAIALVTLAISVLLSVVAARLPLYSSVPELLSTAVSAIGLCASSVALGFASGGIVGLSSEVGHNRNATSASLAGGVAGVAGSVLFWRLLAPWGIEAMGPVTSAGRSFPDSLLRFATSGGPGVFWLAVGGAVATFVSVAASVGSVLGTKYCEDCRRVMDRRKLTGLPWPDAEGLARDLPAIGMAAWKPIPVGDSPDDGSVDVYRCPKCGRGYLEVSAHIHGRWPNPEKPEKRQVQSTEWRIASLPLSAAEVDSVRLFDGSKESKAGWLR